MTSFKNRTKALTRDVPREQEALEAVEEGATGGGDDQEPQAHGRGHAALLDAYGVAPALRDEVSSLHRAWRASVASLKAAREAIEDPAVAIDSVRLTEALTEMELAQEAADGLYARWAELTEKVG